VIFLKAGNEILVTVFDAPLMYVLPETETREDKVMDFSRGSVCAGIPMLRVPLMWIGPGRVSGLLVIEPVILRAPVKV
jgi:hypothetical protein